MNIYKKIGVCCVGAMGVLLVWVIIACEFFDGLPVMLKIVPIYIAIVVLVCFMAMMLDIFSANDD